MTTNKVRHVFPAFNVPPVQVLLDEYKANGQRYLDGIPSLVCDGCHLAKPDVQEVEDPYVKEINEESVLTILCDDCMQNRMDDI